MVKRRAIQGTLASADGALRAGRGNHHQTETTVRFRGRLYALDINHFRDAAGALALLVSPSLHKLRGISGIEEQLGPGLVAPNLDPADLTAATGGKTSRGRFAVDPGNLKAHIEVPSKGLIVNLESQNHTGQLANAELQTRRNMLRAQLIRSLLIVDGPVVVKVTIEIDLGEAGGDNLTQRVDRHGKARIIRLGIV